MESALHEPHLLGTVCRHRDHLSDGKWMVSYAFGSLMAPGLSGELLLLPVVEVRLKCDYREQRPSGVSRQFQPHVRLSLLKGAVPTM